MTAGTSGRRTVSLWRRPAARIGLAWLVSVLAATVLSAWASDSTGWAQLVLVLMSSFLPAALAVLTLPIAVVRRGLTGPVLAAIPPEAFRLAVMLPEAAQRGATWPVMTVAAAIGLLCALAATLGTGLLLARPVAPPEGAR